MCELNLGRALSAFWAVFALCGCFRPDLLPSLISAVHALRTLAASSSCRALTQGA
jgi:hypothetical protein